MLRSATWDSWMPSRAAVTYNLDFSRLENQSNVRELKIRPASTRVVFLYYRWDNDVSLSIDPFFFFGSLLDFFLFFFFLDTHSQHEWIEVSFENLIHSPTFYASHSRPGTHLDSTQWIVGSLLVANRPIKRPKGMHIKNNHVKISKKSWQEWDSNPRPFGPRNPGGWRLRVNLNVAP